jgi:hypothetical protein
MSRYVRVTRGAPGVYNGNGLEVLRLALWERGVEVSHVSAISGIAGRQNFRTLAHERRGVFEPIPEGRYTNLGHPEWHGRVGDHSDKWSEALGAVVIEIYGERAIMLHIDGNAPGSAGCLCPLSYAELDTVLNWWAGGKPEWLECDWGLGTLKPPEQATPALEWIKLFVNHGRANAYRAGRDLGALSVRCDYQKGKLSGLSVNNQAVALDRVASLQLLLSLKGKEN